MTNYHERYKSMKKALKWGNKDVANAVGIKLNSVEVSLSKSKTDEDFPNWAKGMIEVYETMLGKATIVFN